MASASEPTPTMDKSNTETTSAKTETAIPTSTESTTAAPPASTAISATSAAPHTSTEANSAQPAISKPVTEKELKLPEYATPAETPSTETPTETPVETPASETELDFSGNVNVDDNLPTKDDLEKVKDLLILDAEGHSRPFETLYKGKGVAPRQMIIFVRHFFCGNCQEYLRTLSSSITPEELLSLPTPTFITVIGCGRPELIDMYLKETGCPFPVYADPTRKLYDYLGMNRTLDLGSKKPEYHQSNLFITTVQSIVQGLRTGRKALSGGDFKQVGGEFMFDKGKVVWCHRMRNTRDHAEVPEIRKVIGLEDAKPPMRKRWSHGIKEMKSQKRSSSWARSHKEGRKSAERPIEEEQSKAEVQPSATA